MTATRPEPWHRVFRLKEELRSGELTLAEFAADLHEVTLGEGRRPIYEDPARFFALTFPTPALRELVKDVAERLAGRSTKAVRQLELTYGGGKTHTLITLYHLFRDPDALSEVKAVQEFRQHVGRELPKAFTVSLCFDKIDVERGIDGVYLECSRRHMVEGSEQAPMVVPVHSFEGGELDCPIPGFRGVSYR